MEDSEIIELYLSRNQLAVNESEKKYGRYCGSIARNILDDVRDSDEALNETWLRAWTSIPPAMPKVLSAFLGGITRNICLNIIRKGKAEKRSQSYAESYDELESLIGSEDVESEYDAKELQKCIDLFTEDLPAEQRQVFICRYVFFASIEEIADKFGYSREKVKSMLFRIRNNLKKRLNQEGLI